MAFSTPPSLRATSPIAHSCAEEEYNTFLSFCSFLRNKTKHSNLLPCRVPLYCGVFLQRKNIGEVARSDGGVKEKDKKVWLFRLYRKIQSPHKSYMIYEGFL